MVSKRKNISQYNCDFETDDICGWTYEQRQGLEWKRVMAANVFTTFKTGPRYDHTTLTANGGHYMLMESLTKNDDLITLTSPIYERNLSLKTACCFQFYYFMYGAGVGDLFVVVKPVTLSLNDLFQNRKELIKFQKYGNQNNVWNEAHFNIEELKEDFQIIFVAKSGHGYLSDIAVDDVKLLTGDACKALDHKDDDDVSNQDNDSKTYESIYEMESCVGRCFDAKRKHFSTIVPLADITTKQNETQVISLSTKEETTTTSSTTPKTTTNISTTPTTVKPTAIAVKSTPTTIIIAIFLFK